MTPPCSYGQLTEYLHMGGWEGECVCMCININTVYVMDRISLYVEMVVTLTSSIV